MVCAAKHNSQVGLVSLTKTFWQGQDPEIFSAFNVQMYSILTSVDIDCSVWIHNIKAFIKQDVGIPPSLLPSIGHPNKDNE